MKTKEYFEKNAAAYDAKREKGFLGWLRNNEKKVVMSLLDIKKGESVLDAGCGEGYYAQVVKSMGASPFGIDVSKEMIAKLQAKGIPGKAGDLEDCSLAKKFDKIVCAGVLEFTASPEKAVQMLAQHLKPKGKIVILYSRPSPGTLAYVLIHRLHGLKLKIISKTKLQKSLKKAGLNMVKHKKLPLFGGVALIEHERQ